MSQQSNESFSESRLKSIRASAARLCAGLDWRAGAVALAYLVGIGAVDAQPAPAADAMHSTSSMQVVLLQSKVIKDAQGKELLVPADEVKPGDVLEYRVTYTNNTGKPVTGLVANLPLPEGLEYLPRSAKPGATLAQAATKDGQFGTEPLSRMVDGKPQPVPYNEYRALRWSLGKLPANGVAAVSARARVEAVAPPAPAAPPAQPVAVAPKADPMSR